MDTIAVIVIGLCSHNAVADATFFMPCCCHFELVAEPLELLWFCYHAAAFEHSVLAAMLRLRRKA